MGFYSGYGNYRQDELEEFDLSGTQVGYLPSPLKSESEKGRRDIRWRHDNTLALNLMSPARIVVYNREDFRKWLAKNHDKVTKVAVVMHKRHTGKPAPTHHELIEEAICFGWIDTTIKRLDEHTFMRNFSRRNENSKWSDNTLSYARSLIRRGLMTQWGMHFYRQGKAKPTHDHGISKNPNMPKELKAELLRDKIAFKNFKKLPPSTTRMLYRWILRGVALETRMKRIKQIVAQNRADKRNFIGAAGADKQ